MARCGTSGDFVYNDILCMERHSQRQSDVLRDSFWRQIHQLVSPYAPKINEIMLHTALRGTTVGILLILDGAYQKGKAIAVSAIGRDGANGYLETEIVEVTEVNLDEG